MKSHWRNKKLWRKIKTKHETSTLSFPEEDKARGFVISPVFWLVFFFNAWCVLFGFAEKIVMTPKKPRVSNSTRLKIERKSFPVTPGSQRGGSGQSNGAASSAATATPKGTKVHVAGGSYAGIVINKQQDDDDVGELSCSCYRHFLGDSWKPRF